MSTESFDSLWSYCTDKNRLVPMPLQWSHLFDLLRNKQQMKSGGWEPSPPLILAAWHHAMPVEKRLRFRDHIEWAHQEGQIEEIGEFLRSLSESQWCHLGEV